MTKDENIVINPDGKISYLEKQNPYEEQTTASIQTQTNDEYTLVLV